MGEYLTSWVQINVVIDDICDAALVEIFTQDWTETHSLSLNVFNDGCSHQRSTSIRFWKYSIFCTQKSSLISMSYKQYRQDISK